MKHVSPSTVVTGQSIAKRHQSARERASGAAAWLAGTITVKPTAKMAAAVFRVSEALVREEAIALGKEPSTSPRVVMMGDILADLTPTERVEFVRSNLLTLWDTIETVTA
jgi:hypothetical protein